MLIHVHARAVHLARIAHVHASSSAQSHPVIPPPPSPPQVMHASSVRSLHFVGDSLLYTASEDEVAQWNLPLF